MASRGNPNPTGSKPDKLMRDALMVALKREAKDSDGQPTTKLAQIANKLVELAVGGDIQAIKEISDRVDGKPTQPLAGFDGGALIPDMSGLTDEQLEILAAAQRVIASVAPADAGATGDRPTTH